MAGRILKEDIETLRRQADIVAVVGDYTNLQRAGRSFKGLCPFHAERTPSFTVTPDGNFFHCFGCDASGDLYDFLMRVEGLDFPEAVEALARRAGFQLRYEELSSQQRQAIGERSRLIDTARLAQEFFRDTLYTDRGKPARDYLRSRGFGREDAERFELGFAPNEWDALSRTLTQQGLNAQDLISVGVSMRNERGGLRDRFRGRLIFPIHDPGGDVIGFGGRILDGLDYGDFEPPKYLNSPETPLYKKNRVLYGVPQARAEIVRAQQVLICEGYTDVMALHQAGFANAVATCGTAVGTEHLRILARYAEQVVLAFDGDQAGMQAAERAWEAARELAAAGSGSLDLRVLELPDGTDPADLVAAVGAPGLRRSVTDAAPIVRFVIAHRLAGADLSSEAGRTAALRDLLEVVGREPDRDLRREWARTEIADRLGVAYDFVVQTAGRMQIDIDRHEGVAIPDHRRSADAATHGPVGGREVTRTAARRERDVLRVALQRPELLPEEWFELRSDDFTHPTAQTIFVALDTAGGPGVELPAVLEVAPDDELRAVIRRLALEDDPELSTADDRNDADGEVAPLVAAERVRRLLAGRIEQQERSLRERLSGLHHGADAQQVRDLQRELSLLQQRRRELRAPAG